eukprot:94844-Prorocentrum_minimum.AAC.1
MASIEEEINKYLSDNVITWHSRVAPWCKKATKGESHATRKFDPRALVAHVVRERRRVASSPTEQVRNKYVVHICVCSAHVATEVNWLNIRNAICESGSTDDNNSQAQVLKDYFEKDKGFNQMVDALLSASSAQGTTFCVRLCQTPRSNAAPRTYVDSVRLRNLRLGWVCSQCTSREHQKLLLEDPQAAAVEIRVPAPQQKVCNRMYVGDDGVEITCGSKKPEKTSRKRNRGDGSPLEMTEFNKYTRKLYDKVDLLCEAAGLHAVVCVTGVCKGGKLRKNAGTKCKTLQQGLCVISHVHAKGACADEFNTEYKCIDIWRKVSEKVLEEEVNKNYKDNLSKTQAKAVSAIRQFCTENKDAGFSDEMASALEAKQVFSPDLLAHLSDDELRNDLGFTIGHLAFTRQWLKGRQVA